VVGVSRQALPLPLSIALALLLSACVTQQVAERAKARPATLEFYQLPGNGAELEIFWHETPYLADTRLRVNTPLESCDTLSAYVNPETAGPHRLSSEGISVAPKLVKDDNAEMAQWADLPDDPCGVLITAGYVMDTAFIGLSFSTREGVFHRESLRLSAAKDEEALPGGWWLMAVAEPFMLPVYPIIGLASRTGTEVPKEWLSRTITVSFEFPDRRRRETTIGFEEAAQLLVGQHYLEGEAYVKTPWVTVRYWTRAALVKLDLDFREQATPPSLTSTELVSVGGYAGRWVFDTRDGRPPATMLSVRVLDAKYVRFSVVPANPR
jgi:hypothetical protein